MLRSLAAHVAGRLYYESEFPAYYGLAARVLWRERRGHSPVAATFLRLWYSRIRITG